MEESGREGEVVICKEGRKEKVYDGEEGNIIRQQGKGELDRRGRYYEYIWEGRGR